MGRVTQGEAAGRRSARTVARGALLAGGAQGEGAHAGRGHGRQHRHHPRGLSRGQGAVAQARATRVRGQVLRSYTLLEADFRSSIIGEDEVQRRSRQAAALVALERRRARQASLVVDGAGAGGERRKKKKVSEKELKSRLEHEKFLLRMGYDKNKKPLPPKTERCSLALP